MKINLSVLETAHFIFHKSAFKCVLWCVLVNHQACAQHIPCAIFPAFERTISGSPGNTRPLHMQTHQLYYNLTCQDINTEFKNHHKCNGHYCRSPDLGNVWCGRTWTQQWYITRCNGTRKIHHKAWLSTWTLLVYEHKVGQHLTPLVSGITDKAFWQVNGNETRG